MIEKKRLGQILLDAIKEDKAVIGTKNVLQYMKGTKFVIFSTFLGQELKNKIVNACKASSIPFLEYDGSSSELGKLFNKPFVISAIAVKSQVDSNFLSDLSLNM